MLEKRRFKNIEYLISLPANYREGERYPVLFYTHGAGGRGRDLSMIENDEVYSLNPCKDEFIIVMPQCFADSWFDIFEQLEEFCAEIYGAAFTDRSRFYATGVSMGGYACYQLMMSLPEYFAAAIVCCGGGMYWNAGRIKDIYVRAVHGKKDEVVFPEESAKMARAIGERAELVLIEDAGHDCWTKTYSSKENYEWLLGKKK